MRCVVLGNSHASALKQGLRRLGTDPARVDVLALGIGIHELQPFSAAGPGGVIFTNGDYRENFRNGMSIDVIDDRHVWGICMGTNTFRLYREEFWATAAPSALAHGIRRPVSEDLLDAMILRDQAHVRTFISQVLATGARCFAVSCPPPREDFAKGNRLGIPAEVIRAIDLRACRLFEDWLRASGVDFVPYPPEVATEEGFLRPRYCEADGPGGRKDTHHANADYGELMMRRVLSRLGHPQQAAGALHAGPHGTGEAGRAR